MKEGLPLGPADSTSAGVADLSKVVVSSAAAVDVESAGGLSCAAGSAGAGLWSALAALAAFVVPSVSAAAVEVDSEAGSAMRSRYEREAWTAWATVAAFSGRGLIFSVTRLARLMSSSLDMRVHVPRALGRCAARSPHGSRGGWQDSFCGTLAAEAGGRPFIWSRRASRCPTRRAARAPCPPAGRSSASNTPRVERSSPPSRVLKASVLHFTTAAAGIYLVYFQQRCGQDGHKDLSLRSAQYLFAELAWPENRPLPWRNGGQLQTSQCLCRLWSRNLALRH